MMMGVGGEDEDDGVDESGGGGAPSWNDQQGRIRRGNSAAEQVYEQAEVSLAESLSDGDGDGDGDRDNVEARASAAAEEDAETLTELARETAELIGRLDEEDVDGVVQAISRGASPVAGAMREMATSPVETQGLLEELAREAVDLVGRLEEEDARGVVQAISRGASPVAGAMREMATSPVETQGLLEELAREAVDLVGRLEEEDARGVVQAISRGASPTSEAMRRMASDSSPSSSPTQQRAANSPQGEGSGREGREDSGGGGGGRDGGDKDMEALAAHGGGENGEDEEYDDPEYDEEEAERRSRVFVDVHVPTPNRGDGLRDTLPAMLDVRIPHVPPRDGERNRPDRPAPRGGGEYDEESLVGSPIIVAYDDEDDWESIGSPVMPYPQTLPGSRQVSSASTAGSRKSKGGAAGSGKKKRAASASVKGKKSSSMAGGQAGEGARRAYSNPRFTDRPRQHSGPHPLAGSLQRGSPKARPFTAKPSHSGEEEQYRPRTPSMNAKPPSPAPRKIRPHTALGISSSSSSSSSSSPPPPLPSSVAVKGAAPKDGSQGLPNEPPSPPPVPVRGPPTSEAPPGWSNEQHSPAVKGATTNAGGPGSLKPMLKPKGSQSKKMNKEDFDKFLRRQLAATASKNCLVEVSERARKAQFRPQTATTRSSASRPSTAGTQRPSTATRSQEAEDPVEVERKRQAAEKARESSEHLRKLIDDSMQQSARRYQLVQGAKPTDAFGAKYQEGSTMTPLLDPQHPHYERLEKERKKIVGFRKPKLTDKELTAFVERQDKAIRERDAKVQRRLRADYDKVVYANSRLREKLDASRWNEMLERMDPEFTRVQQQEEMEKTKRKIMGQLSFLPFGIRKRFDPESEEHIEFVERQTELAHKRDILEFNKVYEGGVTPQAIGRSTG